MGPWSNFLYGKEKTFIEACPTVKFPENDVCPQKMRITWDSKINYLKNIKHHLSVASLNNKKMSESYSWTAIRWAEHAQFEISYQNFFLHMFRSPKCNISELNRIHHQFSFDQILIYLKSMRRFFEKTSSLP